VHVSQNVQVKVQKQVTDGASPPFTLLSMFWFKVATVCLLMMSFFEKFFVFNVNLPF